jgi:transcription elongation GreA/GreB family factor
VSVAFRRESDEEHKEPRFEIPLPVGPNLVTPAGLEQARQQVAALELRVTQELGEGELADAQRSLRYWRTRLATAELAPPPPEDEVAFGSRVEFRLRGQTRTIAIVGDDEADPAAGSIAFSAPLARALIGAAVGDTADFGGTSDAIEILGISRIY